MPRRFALIGSLLAVLVAAPLRADPALDSFARDLDRTESVRAVLSLQRNYAQYAQFGLWSEAGALFAADGSFVFDGSIKPAETARGPAAIAAFLRARYGGGREGAVPGGLSTMMIDAPVVNLAADGESAKARWEAIIFHGHDGQARVEGGVFENDYVRRGGVWRIAAVHYYPEYDGPYETGWTNWGGGDLPLVPKHYDADTAGLPIPPAAGPAPAARATLAALQKRVDALNDEDRVRNLQAAYGYYQDRKMWDDVADLFADEGAVEIGGVGVWRGKAGVRRWLATIGAPGLSHGQLNEQPQFDVTVAVAPGGNEAWARGIELGMLGEADRRQGWWEVTAFRNRFVKEAGVWKLKELRRFPLMKADVFTGWGKGRIADPAPTGANAPDAPVPAADRAPAGLAVPAFLGPHPVTGKSIAATGSGRTVAATALTGAIAPGKPAPIDLAEARRRLARSAAWDGVANVSAGYGHPIDDDDAAGFIGVLATKGFKGGRSGYYVTKASNWKARVTGPPPPVRQGVSYHWLTQPVILVSDDGRSASARLRLFQPRTAKTVGKTGDFLAATIQESTYHDRYVLEDGVWRIWDLTVDPQYVVPAAFKEGLWAGAKDPPPPDPNAPRRAPQIGRGQPQDITAADLGAQPGGLGWPTIRPMWFGYTNPVSGRVPELYQKDCVPCTVRPDLKLERNGYQEPPDAPAANRAP